MSLWSGRPARNSSDDVGDAGRQAARQDREHQAAFPFGQAASRKRRQRGAGQHDPDGEGRGRVQHAEHESGGRRSTGVCSRVA